MKISVLIYKKKDRRSITEINHKLFGRLSRTNKAIYYYSGILENILYHQASKGCYFIQQENGLEVQDTDLYYLCPILVEPGRFIFKTAKQHWFDFAKEHNLIVKNLNR